MLTTASAHAAPQPDPKQRKTLMERAAEYPERHGMTATPATRMITANKGVSLVSQSSVGFLSAYKACFVTSCLDHFIV